MQGDATSTLFYQIEDLKALIYHFYYLTTILISNFRINKQNNNLRVNIYFKYIFFKYMIITLHLNLRGGGGPGQIFLEDQI